MISNSVLHGIMSFFISTKLWLSDVFREKSVKVRWKYNVFLGLCHMKTMISASVLHGIMTFLITKKLWLSDVFREKSVTVGWKCNVFLGLCHMKQWLKLVYFMELWVLHQRKAVIILCISWEICKSSLKTMILASVLHGIMSFASAKSCDYPMYIVRNL